MHCRDYTNALDDYLAGSLSPAETEAFEAHGKDCPACAAELALMGDTLQAWADEAPYQPDEGFLADVMAQVRQVAPPQSKPSLWQQLSGLFADRRQLAPLLVGGLAVLMLLVFLPGQHDPSDQGGTITVAQAPSSWLHHCRADGSLRPLAVGEVLSIDEDTVASLQLSDGRGEITLAGSSTIQATKAGAALEAGRARFDLDLQGQRFEIATAQGTVVVWGTSFEVAINQDDVRVQVFEGRVRFEGPKNTVEARAGELIIATDSGVTTTPVGRNAAADVAPTNPPVMRPQDVAPVDDDPALDGVDIPNDDAGLPDNGGLPTVTASTEPTVATSPTADGRPVETNDRNDLERMFDQ